jgi:superfamily I DNA/RNA helicase
MVQPFFVGGEAGAGKTRRLMDEAISLGSQLLSSSHQSALAMVVMHGARRQLQLTLSRFCPKLPVTITTIHSFALKITNRWRRCLGLSFPIVICESSFSLGQLNGRTLATFDEVIAMACTLLESTTVRNTLAATHPIVLVDEFQDCVGSTLQFVQALGNSSKLLLGADHFQLLHEGNQGCPAVDWVGQLRHQAQIQYQELTGCKRTDQTSILQAARALRDNVKAAQPTVPVYCGYQPGQVAYRIVERFLSWGKNNQISNGTCALIALSMDDSQLPKLLESFKGQLAKKTRRQVNWCQSISEKQNLEELIAELGISPTTVSRETWLAKDSIVSRSAATVSDDVVRFCKLRGISPIPGELVLQFARLAVHNARAFARSSPRFQILTVHGAKNREFDHVFIFWGYKKAGWSVEEQRRLLYNAVTRARVDCTVLFLGSPEQALNDPVVGLIGPALPALNPEWRKKKGEQRSGSRGGIAQKGRAATNRKGKSSDSERIRDTHRDTE